MGYDTDIELERKFSRTIKWILGDYFITQDRNADLFEATDFLILAIEPFKVAVRLRRFNKHYERYRKQFTIRWTRPNGIKTEKDKINEEDGPDYLLYGFVVPEERKFISYFIGDLDVFRACDPKPIGIYPNEPPDSNLAAFNISQLPENFIKVKYTMNADEISKYLKKFETEYELPF